MHWSDVLVSFVGIPAPFSMYRHLFHTAGMYFTWIYEQDWPISPFTRPHLVLRDFS